MMNKTGLGAAGLAGLLLSASTIQAGAQGGGPLFEQGRAVYEANCALCHQASGEGVPPNFPALDGNDNLSDAALIVDRVRAGRNAMPAFPDLRAEEIAAVATYVRNAWSNEFGEVAAARVNELLDEVETAEPERSIWDGVYTTVQAEGARLLYLGGCASCHGRRLNGAPDAPDMQPGPPLAGTIFMREWNGRTLAALFEYARTTMPIRNPGQFSDQQYIDIIAYMLSYGDIPAGDEALAPDMEVLSNIVIERDPPGE